MKRRKSRASLRCCLHKADEFEHLLAEPVASLIVSLADQYDTIVSPATANGKNFMPRASAMLDVMQVSEIISVKGPDTFERPIYAGNAIQTVQATDATKMITVRTASFASAEKRRLQRQSRKSPRQKNPGLSSYVGAELSSSDRPELTSAKIIISGGRALGSAEKFTENDPACCR